MSDNRLPDYLDNMQRAAFDARIFTEGMARKDFLVDRRINTAVVMSLIVIGEAATRIMRRYPEFAERHPEVSWHMMRGLRSRIARGYFEIDFNAVWDTVTTALPELLPRLPDLLAEAEREGDDP